MLAKIGIVDTIPAPGTSPGTGAAAASLRIEMGNVVEITGSNDGAVAGTLTLLRWIPPVPTANPQGLTTNIDAAGEWRPFRWDDPINVAAGDAFFDGRYEFAHDEATHWLLWVQGGPASDDYSADARGCYYRQMT